VKPYYQKQNKQTKLTMKKINILISIIIFTFSSQFINAQSMDCISMLRYRKAQFPYEFSNLSKSATCSSGKTYEFIVPLKAGSEYRFSFFASSVFNHQINFRIIDLSSNELVLDLPGEFEAMENNTCALREYFHSKLNKLVHPHYDFYPATSTNLKIIIEIPSVDGENPIDNSIYQRNMDKISGCVTVFVQDKKVDNLGFN